MSDEPLRVMVDTNVWVDSYCVSHAACDEARDFFRAANARGAVLLYPVHVAKDVLHVLNAEFGREARRAGEGALAPAQAFAAREAALACTRAMMDAATAVGADGSDLWLACEYLPAHHDFEDNLVLSACRRAKADCLVTSDRNLIAHADVMAKTPAEMTHLLRSDRLLRR